MTFKIPTLAAMACSLAVMCVALPAGAATIAVAPNGITDLFGNQNTVADAGDAAGLLFDEARTGGGDNTTSALNPARTLEGVSGTNSNWAAGLTPGTAGTIDFTGFGFALSGGGTTASSVSLNIIYLGADGGTGGTDNELVGTVTDTLNFTGAGEYGWVFDTPLQFAWDGLNNRFRFEISGIGGNLRFKQRPVGDSPSGQGGVTLSVGGSFVVPEPSSVLLGAMGLFGFVATRRR